MMRFDILMYFVGMSLLVALLWLTTTEHPTVWPVRNTVQYHALQTWWGVVGFPHQGEVTSSLSGVVRDEQGQPLAGAWVLVSAWDGTTYHDYTDAAGAYQITGVPLGAYQPIATAPGYESALHEWTTLEPLPARAVDFTLSAEVVTPLRPATDLRLSEAAPVTCTHPIESQALRQQATFDNAGQPNSLTLFYRPLTETTHLPVLLTIYPGPADNEWWECTSVPLAAAGYAVLAVGPEYSFDVERQVDEQERLINLAQAEAFPQTDGQRVGLLGGSFSSIHVQRLIQRRQDVQAALLLGPPTDLFDMRRRQENGRFIPPFGLDQVLIAAGLPNHETLRYWRYSGAYHVRPDFPPLAILHSLNDDVVPFQQSEVLADNLDRVGAPYELHIFAGAGHYLIASDGDEDALEVYGLTLDFLARHLR